MKKEWQEHFSAKQAELNQYIKMAERVDQLLGVSNDLQYPTVGFDGPTSKQVLNFWPNNAEHSRKIVGKFIFATGQQPGFRKWDESQAEARFELPDFIVAVNSYQGKNCRLVPKTIEVPAQEATTRTIMVMECDEPAEGAVPLSQAAEEAPAAEPF